MRCVYCGHDVHGEIAYGLTDVCVVAPYCLDLERCQERQIVREMMEERNGQMPK